MGKFDTLIHEAEQANPNLPPGLLEKVMMTESSGNPNAVGPVTRNGQQAQGLMQLMPGTAKELGVTDPFDPAQNINAGAKYLSQQFYRFGDPRQAVAAYNFGPGNVAAGKPFPTETQNYIQKTLGGMDNLEAVVQMPAFRGLPADEQIKVLDRMSPDFAGLPQEEKSRAMEMIYATRPSTSPAGTPTLISNPPPTETKQEPAAAESVWKNAFRGILRIPGTLMVGPLMVAEKFATMVGLPYVDTMDPKDLPSASLFEDFVVAYEQMSGDTLPAPKSMKGKMAERVTSEVGAAMTPLAALRLMTVMTSPWRIMRIEAALATSGAITGEYFRDIFPQHPDLADFFGEALGSFGAGGLLNVIRHGRALTGSLLITDDEMRRRIGKQFLEYGREEKVTEGVAKAQELGQEIPNFKPTTGGATGEAGLTQAQRSYERSGVPGDKLSAEDRPHYATGAVHQRFKVRESDNVEAVNDRLGELTPDGNKADVGVAMEQKQRTRTQDRDVLAQGKLMEVEAARAIVSNDVSEATKQVIINTEQQLRQAEQRALARMEALKGRVNEQQRGRILQQEYQAELDASRTRVTAAYNRVDPTIKLPMNHTVEAATDLKKGIFTSELDPDADLVPKGILKDIEAIQEKATQTIVARQGPMGKPFKKQLSEGPAEVSFGELDALKKRIQDEYRNTPVSNGRKRMRLKDLEDGVLQDLDALADDAALAARYPGQAEAYDSARQLAFKEIARLKTGTIDRLRQKNAQGRYRMVHEDMADLFINGETPVDDLMAALGGRGGALYAVREHARDEFYKAAKDYGKGSTRINTAAADRWVDTHPAIFEAFPELREEFTGATRQTQILKEMEAEAKALDPKERARLENPALFAQLDTLDQKAANVKATVERIRAEGQRSRASLWMGKDVDAEAERIVGSRFVHGEIEKVMKDITHDPDAVKGFHRALWDASLSKFQSAAMIDGMGRPRLMANKMREFIRDNEDWMTEAFGAERMASMKKIEKAMEMIQNPAKPGSDTAINFYTAVTDLGPMLSRLYAHERGIISLKWIIGERTARMLGRRLAQTTNAQAAALLEEAFFDPTVAQTFRLMAKADTSDSLIHKRLRLHLLNMNQLEPDQFPEDDNNP